MNDPQRWIDGASGNDELLQLLRASKDAGPTLAEKAALGARLGVSTTSVWLTPLLKAVLASSGIVAGVLAYQLLAPQEPSQPVESKASGDAEIPRDGLHDLAPSPVQKEVAPQENPTDSAIKVEKGTDELKPRPLAPAKSASTQLPPSPQLPSEARLLSQARHALESDPERALALINSHEKNYPAGVLAQERGVLKVKALQNLGRTQAAVETEKKFRTEHPESIHHVGNSK